MLTLIVIPIEGVRTEKLIESFAGIECEVKVLDNDRNLNEEVTTEWKMYMFADEVLTEELNVALPIFLKAGKSDVYKIYKRKEGRACEGEKEIFSIAPRVFKAEIKMQGDCLLPINWDECKMDTILNGFIVEGKT